MVNEEALCKGLGDLNLKGQRLMVEWNIKEQSCEYLQIILIIKNRPQKDGLIPLPR